MYISSLNLISKEYEYVQFFITYPIFYSFLQILEKRLKITLPDDLPAALADGVVLCHLINHVRKSTIPIIHVPSAGVVSIFFGQLMSFYY